MSSHFLKQFLIIFAICFSYACDSEDDSKKEPTNPQPQDATVIADQMPAGSEGGSTSGTPAGATGGLPAGSTGGLPGGSMVRMIESCEQLCAVYEECGASSPWDDCLSGCQEEGDFSNQAFRGYVSCVRVETCANIGTCQPPLKPLPTCDETCTQIEACEQDFRVPSRLNLTCTEACQDPLLSNAIRGCASDAGDALCEKEQDFSLCVLAERDETCSKICEIKQQCQSDLDQVECVFSCINEAPQADPIAEHRRNIQKACLSNATDCDAATACTTTVVPVQEMKIDEFCTVANGCGILVENACPALAGELLARISEEGINCLITALTADCSASLSQCLVSNQNFVDTSACTDYCYASAQCDPQALISEFECLSSCQNSQMRDSETFGQYDAVLVCANANNCEDFNACVNRQKTACQSTCETASACGVMDTNCAQNCEIYAGSKVEIAKNACQRLVNCEHLSQCDFPQAPRCDLICEQIVPCGIDQSSCMNECIDQSFLYPETFLPMLSCVNMSTSCESIMLCGTERQNGNACLNACDLEKCNAQDPENFDMSACVVACARGEWASAEQALGFELAIECFKNVDRNAPNLCQDLGACRPTIEADSGCLEACQFANTCGLTEIVSTDVDACVLACTNGSGITLAQKACSLSAGRRMSDCYQQAECFDIMAPVATPACQNYCDQKLACSSEDTFICMRNCVAESGTDEALGTCAQLSACENLTNCETLQASTSTLCTDACASLAMNCSDLLGAGQRLESEALCAQACVGAAIGLGGENWQTENHDQQIGECLSGLSADRCSTENVNACLSGQANSDELCARVWTAMSACAVIGLFFTEDAVLSQCAMDARQNYAQSVLRVECIEAVDPNDLFNCGTAIQSCLDNIPL